MLADIKSPADLRHLSIAELEALAEEIRTEIIKTTLKNGGHLSSNLGTVELTLALHYVFDTPVDKLIWDVGHQCYTHKLLTGRYENFSTLRCEGGISGFPKSSESCYDVFNTGHSSTAISAALGMARARDKMGESYNVIAVVGDGAMGGGMSFEALNDAGDRKHKMIIILNDNEMSISRNVGAVSSHLNKLRTARTYRKSKRVIERFLIRLPLGKKTMRLLERIKNSIRYLFLGQTLFDTLGIKYLGPIDGHALNELIDIFERSKSEDVPVLLHTVTKKGKGYKKAEIDPTKYHGISSQSKKPSEVITFSETLGQCLCALAEKDNRICAVTAGMTTGTGLGEFADCFKDGFFDAGIAEQHALTMAAGLAAGGLRPFVAIYASFLQRGFDQLFHDICLQNLPVTVCIDRAGLTGEDGETHQGIYDVGYLRAMPNLTIMAPRDNIELKNMLEYILTLNAPVAIRYPRGGMKPIWGSIPLIQGKWDIIKAGELGNIIAFGACLQNAISASQMLMENGKSYGVIDARFLKPFDTELLLNIAEKPIAIIEDNAMAGGLGEAVSYFYASKGINAKLKFFTVADIAVQHASIGRQQIFFGIDAQSVADALMED